MRKNRNRDLSLSRQNPQPVLRRSKAFAIVTNRGIEQADSNHKKILECGIVIETWRTRAAKVKKLGVSEPAFFARLTISRLTAIDLLRAHQVTEVGSRLKLMSLNLSLSVSLIIPLLAVFSQASVAWSADSSAFTTVKMVEVTDTTAALAIETAADKALNLVFAFKCTSSQSSNSVQFPGSHFTHSTNHDHVYKAVSGAPAVGFIFKETDAARKSMIVTLNDSADAIIKLDFETQLATSSNRGTIANPLPGVLWTSKLVSCLPLLAPTSPPALPAPAVSSDK